MNVHDALALEILKYSLREYDEEGKITAFMYALVENGCHVEAILRAMEYVSDMPERTMKQ